MTATSVRPAWTPQRSSPMPHHRHRPFQDRVSVPVTDRAWPSARLERAPLRVSVQAVLCAVHRAVGR